MATNEDTSGRSAANESGLADQLPRKKSRSELLPRAPVVRAPDNVWFRLLVPAAVLFCAAVMIFVVSGLGDPETPVNRFISRIAPATIAGLSALVLIIGFVAMTVDRRRTLRLQREAARNSPPPGSAA